MARLKIDLPQQFIFSTIIPVRISDINYGNHLGNDAVLSIIHEARMQYLKTIGYTELEFAGAGLIMADVAIQFKSEAFYGDVLRAFLQPAEITRVGFELFYKLVKQDADTVVAIAKTAMLCFDYTKRKIVPLPAEAITQLNKGI